MKKIKVTVWNENFHETHSEAIRLIYPNGIHGAIAEGLSENPLLEVRTATMDMPEQGLSEEILNDTDVLVYWSHVKNGDISDVAAERIYKRVLAGMGLIVLHSARNSKAFIRLMGTSCRSKWRENDETERLFVIEPSHPIASGLPEYIVFPEAETYADPMDIPTPDELVFISWFAGGNVLRSGCCWKRGRGKIFYFSPGHESYPTFFRSDVRKILDNAVQWAKPNDGPVPVYGHCEPLENLK